MIYVRMALAVATLLGASFCFVRPDTAGPAEVKGRITNVVGGAVPGASIAFVSNGQKPITIEAERDGTYIARLQPGIYQMCVTAYNFYEMCRAAFSIGSGRQVQFSFQLLDVVFSDPVTIGSTNPSQSSTPVPRDPYNYQQEFLAAVPNGLQPLVLFGGREKRAESITYTGLVRHGKQLPVVYTYDLLTVRAQVLTYFPKDGSIQGTGNVTFEDGKQKQRGSKIEISFHDGRPEARLSR
jgi:hypothetical protein